MRTMCQKRIMFLGDYEHKMNDLTEREKLSMGKMNIKNTAYMTKICKRLGDGQCAQNVLLAFGYLPDGFGYLIIV